MAAAKERWRNHLEEEFEVGQAYKPNKADWLDGAWSGLATPQASDERRVGATGVAIEKLKELGHRLVADPEGLQHPPHREALPRQSPAR